MSIAPRRPSILGTLAKVITEIRDVRSTSVPASMFEFPAGYREVPATPPR